MSTPKINPNYFAVIPASVRYDRDLSAAAKLLYGEIAALCNQEGFCWASNRYFSGLYDTNPRTVQRWLDDLAAHGYIVAEYSDTNSGTSRNLYLTEAHDKNVVGGVAKMSYPHDKNATHNKTTNNTENTITSKAEASDSNDATDVLKVYELYLKCFKLSEEDGITTLEQAKKRYKLTDGRRAAIRRRLKDAGVKMLSAAILGYSREPWYKGDNDRSWTADLEKFICRSYEKVEEGANKYEAQSKQKNTNDPWNS